MTENQVRVLVVDDSALMRKLISDIINTANGLEVVGTACNGQEAIEQVAKLRPDVVTLDVEMPVMNGLQALEQIMRLTPTPVVMLSSVTRSGAQETIKSLELGAVDFVCKPSASLSLDIRKVQQLLRAKVRMAAKANMRIPSAAVPVIPREITKLRQPASNPADQVVVIGSSTGGPRALETVLTRLPGGLPAGVLIAQHMPEGFTASMAERFDTLSQLQISEARDGDLITPGCVLIAPGGKHLLVGRHRHVEISDAPPHLGVKPGADLLMESAAQQIGADCLGVILTGMGRDGADGMLAIRKAGGRTIAQDEESCVVYGMPRAAVEIGAIEVSAPLDQIAENIVRILQEKLSGFVARPSFAGAAK
jgi:two-component system, chemotaxis family, protein-glutamate methylesterase/glutaminase